MKTERGGLKAVDLLAEERTCLANERTLLAYTRTAMAFFITGATLMKFFDHRVYEVGGAVALALGLATQITGMVRYVQVKRMIARMLRPALPDHGEDDE